MKKKLTVIFFILAAINSFASGLLNGTDYEKEKAAYSKKISITPKSGVTFERNRIVIQPKFEDVEYVISGYFNGQIVNRTKGTILKLKDAFIESTDGEPAVLGEAKTEISSTKNTKNWIVGGGMAESKNGAVQSKKKLVFGGSGELYVVGKVCHGVKGDDVKLKGSGDFYFCGTSKGSAINCSSFTSEIEKSFRAYFLNSKNGIKADETISIASGNFYFSNLETAFKTDTAAEKPNKPHGITISGGKVHHSKVGQLYKTEADSCKVSAPVIKSE